MPWLTKKSKERGQAAIEFILVVGAMMVIIMYAFPFITRHAELNKGIAAARDGAQFGATMRGMGFRGSDVGETSPGVIKIDRIEYDITENPDGVDDVEIWIYVRGPDYLTSDAAGGTVRDTIRNQARRYIAYTLTGEWPGTVFSNDLLTGEYYKFAPVRCNSDTWIET